MTDSTALLRELLRRDLDVRWKGSLLGAGWIVAQPLGWMALYLVVFGTVLRIPPPAGGERYGFALYLLSGLLPFLAMQEGIVRSASTWIENAALLRKVKVPPAVFVVTVCLSALLLELVALALLAGWVGGKGLLEPSRLLWLLPGLAAQFLLTLVPAFLVAILAAFLRDLLLALPFLLSTLFYLTPIVYPREMAPEGLRPILDLNPVAWVLQFHRAAFAGGTPPSFLSMAVGFPLLLILVFVLARGAGRLRPHLADIL